MLGSIQEGEYVLVARNDFFEGEKLCLCWRGLRRVPKAVNSSVHQVEELRNGHVGKAHATRLKLRRYSLLDEKAITSHVLSSETGMPVSRLLRLVEDGGQLKVLVRCKGFNESETTEKPLAQLNEDVSKLVRKLLDQNSTPPDTRQNALVQLALYRRGVYRWPDLDIGKISSR